MFLDFMKRGMDRGGEGRERCKTGTSFIVSHTCSDWRLNPQLQPSKLFSLYFSWSSGGHMSPMVKYPVVSSWRPHVGEGRGRDL